VYLHLVWDLPKLSKREAQVYEWAESRQVVEIEHRHPHSSRDLSE
jgi:hypothetical protein